MANVEKRKQDKPDKTNGNQQLQRREAPELATTERAPLAARAPFELLRDLMRWDPFGPEALFRDPFRGMQRLVRDLMTWGPAYGDRTWDPEFEVRESADNYTIIGDVPGLAANDLEVSVSGDRLQITGKREDTQETTEGAYHASERAYGTFTRTFELPDSVDADKIVSSLDNGVLKVVLPKKPGTTRATRKIEIKSEP